MRVATRGPREPLTSAGVSRPLSSLLLAAAVSTVAALGVGGASHPVPAASADDAPPAAAEATTLQLGEPTPNLAPRAVEVPDRDLRIAETPPPEPLDPPDERSIRGTGRLLAATGTSRDPIEGGGRTVRFSVEVEEGTGLDPDDVAAIVESALYDQRSWARDHDLQRVAPEDAWLHVVVATPATIDRLCARAGLNTAGWLSCWNGRVAAINLARWTDGVTHIDDLDLYRRYVVNHEVGHGLGHDHVRCPGSGRLAPLMAQQTKSLGGCVANEWPYPDA